MLIDTIHKRSKVDIGKLNWIAATASKRYKSYQIPKRDGTPRQIEHPSRELKAIQRWVNRIVLQQLPVHRCATAYKKGAKISTNAALHRSSKYTLRFDFSDYFPSFQIFHILLFLRRSNENFGLNLSNEDISFAANILTKDHKLTIGAPSSPILSNAMMFDFDENMQEFAKNNDVVYTRYADDLFFSSDSAKNFDQLESYIRHITKSYPYAELNINDKKTAFLSKKYRRSITGLIITSDHKVSIGRSRKREIKSLIFQYICHECKNISYLSGMLAFALDAEPNFVEALKVKYGLEVVEDILKKGGRPQYLLE